MSWYQTVATTHQPRAPCDAHAHGPWAVHKILTVRVALMLTIPGPHVTIVWQAAMKKELEQDKGEEKPKP